MDIKGKLLLKFDIQKIGDKFQKREFVVEFAENPDYPEVIKLEFIQDKCSLLDLAKVGQTVSVEFNLKGRAWTNQQGITSYFNTLQAWKIDIEAGQPVPAQDANWSQPDEDPLPF
jgi:hypothetical protein